MNFGFTEEQAQLRDQVRRFLDDQCPMPEVRKVVATADGFSRKQWQQMGELGWLGLIVPEAYGGLGLTWVDVIVVLEETGRTLYPSPYVSHTLAESLIADGGSDEQKRKYLPALATGQQIATIALLDEADVLNDTGVTLRATRQGPDYVLNGTKRFVPDAGAADLFLVAFRSGTAGEVRVGVVEKGQSGVEVSSYPTMDATKRNGTLKLTNVLLPAAAVLTGGGFAQISVMLDKGAVAVTAESVGAAEAALQMTSQYAKDRTQFGAPIGKYQGVKHRLAEIYVDVESAKSLVYYAAWCIDQSPKELPRAASLAKGYASDTFPKIGIDGVQLHGAIGFTAEYDVQLYLKRTKWMRPTFGDAEFHYDRVAQVGGL